MAVVAVSTNYTDNALRQTGASQDNTVSHYLTLFTLYYSHMLKYRS